MTKLYVAWQDMETREWIPVAMLEETESGYLLSYTNGAKRCKSFSGLGRMGDLDRVYSSETLFPFFENRLTSKSRPEYKSYLKWLGLDEITGTAMSILSVTGGIRATDSFELIPPPKNFGNQLSFDFFPRGLRHMPKETLERVAKLNPGDRLYLLRDIQNEFDSHALLLRTGNPKALIGHVAKYYCSGLELLLNKSEAEVLVHVKQVNLDAPLDMRLLCTLSAPWQDDFQLLECEEDFKPWSIEATVQTADEAIQKAAQELE